MHALAWVESTRGVRLTGRPVRAGGGSGGVLFSSLETVADARGERAEPLEVGG